MTYPPFFKAFKYIIMCIVCINVQSLQQLHACPKKHPSCLTTYYFGNALNAPSGSALNISSQHIWDYFQATKHPNWKVVRTIPENLSKPQAATDITDVKTEHVGDGRFRVTYKVNGVDQEATIAAIAPAKKATQPASPAVK